MLDFQRVNFNPQVVFFFPLVMMDERHGYLRNREQSDDAAHVL